MLASTVDLYRNPRAHFNTTQFNAWAVARRIMRFTRHHLALRFMPPIVVSIAVMPIHFDADGSIPLSPFDPAMFMEDGFLYEEPLNHFIRIQPFNKKYTFLVNAGYLANNFLESERQGYEALREVITRAKKEAHTPDPPPDTTRSPEEVQAAGAEDSTGSVCGTGGDNSTGE